MRASERWLVAPLVVLLLLSAAWIVVTIAVWAQVTVPDTPRPILFLAIVAGASVSLVLAAAIATAASRAPNLLARNTRLAALLYAWGGLVMLGVYEGTDLHWEHGWQYGAAMGLIAIGLLAFSPRLRDPSPRLVDLALWLTAAHGLAALAAIVFLFWSGKVWTAKGDWAANVVFIAGALGVISVCLATLAGRLAAQARS